MIGHNFAQHSIKSALKRGFINDVSSKHVMPSISYFQKNQLSPDSNQDLWAKKLASPIVNPLRQRFLALAQHKPTVSVEEGSIRSELNSIIKQDISQAIQMIGTGYPGPYGDLAVLNKCAQHLTHKGLFVSDDELLINNGVSDGLSRTLRSLLQTDQYPEVLTFSPFFKPQASMVNLAHPQAKLVVSDGQKNYFRPSFNDLNHKITSNSRVLLLTTPHNPTGVVYNVKELTQAIQFCKAHHLYLVIDATYFDMSQTNCYGDLQQALNNEPYSHIAVIGTNSKLLSAAIRSGWLWTPDAALRDHIAHGVTVDLAGVSVMASIAMSVTIDHFIELKMAYTQTIDIKNLWYQCFDELRIQAPAFCQGGLYLTIPTPNQMPGSVFAQLLRDQYDLGVVPFQYFVQDEFDDPPFIRVACVNQPSTQYAIQSYKKFF